jgi:hypothetical protein
MPLKKIIFNKKIYKQDKLLNSYIYNCDSVCSLLVFLYDKENFQSYTDIKTVSNNFKTYGEDSNLFEEFIINYEYYVAGIQYVEYVPSSNDAGENFLAFNMKKYLQIHEPDLHDEIMKIYESKKTNDTIVWK